MYRATVIVEGDGTGNLSAGLAEVQKKVEDGFTGGHDGERDGNYRFKVAVVDPEEAQPGERRIAPRLADISFALDDALASGDLGAISNGLAELHRLRLALEAWDGGLSEADAEMIETRVNDFDQTGTPLSLYEVDPLGEPT